MPRSLADWIDGYLEYTKDQESPEKIHLWVAFSLLSSALQRHVYMDLGYARLYPNIYVLIVAESAKVRKSVAMEMGLALLNDSIPDVSIISGAVTPEGLIKHMNRTTTTPNPNGKGVLVKHDSHILIHADELATLFSFDRSRASRMAILLTEIYSSKALHLHTTARDGQVPLHNLYPTLLAATDPRNLKVLPEESVGGLIGRIIFVNEKNRRHNRAWYDPSAENRKLREALVADLYRINQLQGAFTISDEARDVFQIWYDKQSEIQLNDPRLDAFHERAHDTARKIAMLLCVARANDLVVTKTHMLGGIAFIEKQMPEFSRVVNWASATTYAQTRAKLIDAMRRTGGVSTRRLLLRALTIPHDEFDVLITSLKGEGVIAKEETHDKETFYYLAPEELTGPS